MVGGLVERSEHVNESKFNTVLVGGRGILGYATNNTCWKIIYLGFIRVFISCVAMTSNNINNKKFEAATEYELSEAKGTM
jgi:hypothetical protein